MLSVTLVAILLAIPLSSSYISATLLTRITAVALLFAAVITYNSISLPIDLLYEYNKECVAKESFAQLDAGVSLYSGAIHATTITQYIEVFILVSGALILLP